MGKSNRIRSQRVEAKVNAPETSKKKGMPSWAMTLITIVITVAILFSFVAMIFSANGVLKRWTKVASSDHYKVDSMMMSYLFMTEYQGFLSDYSSYLSTAEEPGMLSLNSSIDLKKQTFGGSPEDTNEYYDAAMLGAFEGTWYDYIMSRVVDGVKTMLVYCEYARENNITLDDADYASIDQTMQTFETYATMMGFSNVNEYFTANIAKGVKEGDVRKCIEYSTLAEKAITHFNQKMIDSVTDTDITTRYEQDKLKYDLVDYTYYTFKVNYDDVKAQYKSDNNLTDAQLETKKDEILKAYQDAIKEAKEKANALNASKNYEEFEDSLFNIITKETVDSAYKSKVENATGILKDDASYIKEQLIKDIVAELKAGKTENTVVVEIPTDEDGEEVDKTTPIKVYGKDTTVEIAKTVNSVKESAFSKAKSSKSSYVIEGAKYVSEDDTFSVWAFEDGRVAGEKKLIAKYDGSKEGEEITNTQGQSLTSVYFLTKARYKDVEPTKNFSYAYFSDKDEATAAIDAIKKNENFTAGTFTSEAFKEIAVEKGAAATNRAVDYQKGEMGVSAFDTWLYGDDVTNGSLTSTPVYDSANQLYIIAIYEQGGNPNWYVNVKFTIANERVQAEGAAIEAKYAVKVSESATKNVTIVEMQ